MLCRGLATVIVEQGIKGKMDKTVESHVPINLRQWLDEQIEREMTDCAPLGFHGLMTALTEESPEVLGVLPAGNAHKNN